MVIFAHHYKTIECICLFSHMKQSIFFHKRKIYLLVYMMDIIYIQRDMPYL